MTDNAEPRPARVRRGRARRGGVPPADQYLDELVSGFAAPLTKIAGDLAAAVLCGLRAIVKAAYLRGRMDMLTEMERAQRLGRPLVKAADGPKLFTIDVDERFTAKMRTSPSRRPL